MSDSLDIPITITSIEDEAFPVWLGFELIDRAGVRHKFFEKAPVILEGHVPATFPSLATIPCQILHRYEGYWVISTRQPLGLSSTNGQSEFEVLNAAVRNKEVP